ncbi:MAG: DEAD/DEAH box helicase [Thermodesulfobacteriota bacterium]
MTDHSSIEALKAAVPRAWHAVLAGFNAPTQVQLEVIPAVMAGGPVLVMAPTASGKTEAYTAPIAEKILGGSGPGGLSAWIVSPTRALVNDLTRRITPPLAAMGLRVGRRTGERREISGADPPHMVVTTPESLDSILTRTPSMLSGARVLVLDDVHILAGTPRGDQLACLVSRVRAVSKDIQLIASSATVDDPEGIAGRYLGRDAGIIQVPGDRPIAAEFIQGGWSGLAMGLQRLTAQGGGVRKVLAFVRRRIDAERLFSMFKGRPPFGDAVFLHHGSLSRSRRETVERRMLTGTAGLCFATTTLEVGIDIGDIDLVVLAEPPPDVSSLLQRIGRGNRRTRTTRVWCMVRDEAQRLRYEHLIEAAGEGRLLGGSYHFCPSVLVQQCLGLLMQTPGKWITAKALAPRLPGWLNRTGWLPGLPELLDHLATQAWLVPAGRSRYTMGEKLEEAFERGLIHTNIDSGAGGVELVDQDTLQVIGSLPRHATGDGPMLLGGRRLRISKTLGRSKALVADTGARADLKVAGRGPLMHATLARDFARFIGLPPDTAPVVYMEDGAVGLFHFLGDLWSALLGVLIQDRTGRKPMRGNAFCLLMKGLPGPFPLNIPMEEIQAAAIRHRIKLLRRVLEGPWAKHMPPEWRTRHLLECLDMEGFQKTLKGMVIQDPAQPAQERVLVRLISPLRAGPGTLVNK